jgi:hypothetical protein
MPQLRTKSVYRINARTNAIKLFMIIYANVGVNLSYFDTNWRKKRFCNIGSTRHSMPGKFYEMVPGGDELMDDAVVSLVAGEGHLAAIGGRHTLLRKKMSD